MTSTDWLHSPIENKENREQLHTLLPISPDFPPRQLRFPLSSEVTRPPVYVRVGSIRVGSDQLKEFPAVGWSAYSPQNVIDVESL